jgi:hypothetical protein
MRAKRGHRMWALLGFVFLAAGLLTAETAWNPVRLEIWLTLVGLALLFPAGWHLA